MRHSAQQSHQPVIWNLKELRKSPNKWSDKYKIRQKISLYSTSGHKSWSTCCCTHAHMFACGLSGLYFYHCHGCCYRQVKESTVSKCTKSPSPASETDDDCAPIIVWSRVSSQQALCLTVPSLNCYPLHWRHRGWRWCCLKLLNVCDPIKICNSSQRSRPPLGCNLIRKGTNLDARNLHDKLQIQSFTT